MTAIVTGGHGFLGSALVAALRARGEYVRIYAIGGPENLNKDWDKELGTVYHLAAKCGGIGANQKHSVEFMTRNLEMGMDILEEVRPSQHRVVMVGTCCSYPKYCPAPFQETDLYNGLPEETNAGYGLAKRTLFALARAHYEMTGLDIRLPILANLYGPRDHFDPERSHAIPAIIKKIVDAKRAGDTSITLWGDGTPTREFLYVDDAVEALMLIAREGDTEPMNVGSGQSICIADLAEIIREYCQWSGEILWDPSKPNGQPIRALDSSRIRALGWEPRVSLTTGLARTIEWYQRCAG